MNDLFALAAFPGHGFGERFESQSIAARGFLQAQQQVDRAFQQPGQQPRALRECRRMAEEVHRHAASAMQWHAIAGNCQPFATFQALMELQHDQWVQLADLYQPQVGGPGFAQQAVELFGVLGVHQYVHGDSFADLRQGPTDLKIAQVRADHHLPSAAAQLIAQQCRVDDFDLFQAQLAIPDIEFVEHGVGEGHELAEHSPMAGTQIAATAPISEPLLVVPGALASIAAEQEEVQHNAVQQRAQQASPQHFGGGCGELHQPEAAAFLAVGPVFAICVAAHARHRRQRITGQCSNMPMHSRVCMLVINRLSWTIRKCETPSSG
ncbi:hypothetical protein D3C84_458880 [compost metagenome]